MGARVGRKSRRAQRQPPADGNSAPDLSRTVRVVSPLVYWNKNSGSRELSVNGHPTHAAQIRRGIAEEVSPVVGAPRFSPYRARLYP